MLNLNRKMIFFLFLLILSRTVGMKKEKKNKEFWKLFINLLKKNSISLVLIF